MTRDARVQLRHTIIKTLVYCNLVAAAWLIIYADVRWPLKGEGQKITEHSYTEYTQEIILFVVAGLFFLTAVRTRPKRSFGMLLAAFFIMALIRELDALFDGVWHGFWKIPCLFVVLGFGSLVKRFRKNFVYDAVEFTERPEFGIFICGFLTVFVFSRLFGSNILWEPLMGDAYIKSVKNAAEEGLELLGYLFFAIAAVEYFIFKNKSLKSK